MTTHYLQTPFTQSDVTQLAAGDVVFLSGVVYGARDAAHKKLHTMLAKGEQLPFSLSGAVIYYVGPTPAPKGHVIGSAGPTTSYRMDAYTPELYKQGLRGTIGKGKRGESVTKALQEYTGVYFGATGGVGALLSRCITSAEVLAFPELGPEAIRCLTVKDFPLIVINDSRGGDLYASVSL